MENFFNANSTSKNNRTSYIVHRTSYIIHHPSYIVHRTSYIVHRTLILLSFFIFQASCCISQVNWSDAVFLKVVKEYQLNADGSVNFHYQHSLKYLTHYAFHSLYGETSIPYNTKFQKVKVNYARTTMADGNVIQSPPNAYNEILPGFAANAPSYNHIRTLVVTHTGLEKEAVAEVDYEITSEKDFYPELMGNECLKTNSPVDEYTYIIRIPATKTLQFKLLNNITQPEITGKGDFTEYKWVFKNLEALSQERFKPNLAYFEPYLLYSTADNLQKVYLKFVSQPSLRYNADEKMIKWAQELRKSAKSEIGFIIKLQDKIAHEVKTYNIPLIYTGYKIHSPAEVFYSNGGTPIEKASLMVALLNSTGIKALPVLIAPTNVVDKEIGNLNVFDEVMVRVYSLPEQFIYLPVTYTAKQDCKFQLNDKTIIPLNSDLKTLEYFTENCIDNHLTLNAQLYPDFSGENKIVKGDFHYKVTGWPNPYFKILTDSNEMIKTLLNSAVPGKDDKKDIVKSGRFESEINFSANCTSASIQKENSYYFYTLPRLNDGFDAWQMAGLSSERTALLKIPWPLDEMSEFEIKLPKNVELVTKTLWTSGSNSVGNYIYDIRKEKSSIFIVRKLQLVNTYITPEQYRDFQALVSNWRDIINRQLVFKTIESSK
jgi:hypothetical protein